MASHQSKSALPSACLERTSASLSSLPASFYEPTGLASAMPLALIAWDEQARIVDWNRAAEEMFGWKSEEILGHDIYQLLPASRQEWMRGIVRELTETGLPDYSINENVTKDGRTILCEWHNTRLRAPATGEVIIVSMARDITGQQRAARERERLLALASASNARCSLDEILLILRQAVIEAEGFDRAGIFLMKNGFLQGTWGTGIQGELKDEHHWRGCPEEFPYCIRQVALGKEAYVLERGVIPTAPPEGWTGREPRDFLAVGLYAQNELIGVLSADCIISGRPITEEMIQALLSFCEQAAVTISNACLVEERKRLQERSHRLRQIGTAINASRHLDTILLMVRDAVVETAGFDRAGVFLMEGTLLRGAWGTDRDGKARDEHDYRVPLRTWGEYTEALLSGQKKYIIEELDGGKEPYPCAIVALWTGGEMVGLLCMDNFLTRRPVVPETVEPMLEFAESAAGAIRNARLLTDRARHLNQQRRLASLAAAINANTDLNAILRMARDAVVEAGGFDRAAVFLYDAPSNMLEGTWGTDRSGQPVEISTRRFEADQVTPLARVVRGEQDYSLTVNFTEECHLQPNDPMYGTTSHAVVPLRAGDQVIGAICVDNLLRQAPITLEDIQGLLPFAEQTAVAIQNARLFEALQQAQDALIRSEKLRAVGELASGVAHNVNNVLAAVLGYAELIKEAEEASPEVKLYARTIERAALDGAEIVRRVQHFARRETDARKSQFDLSVIVQEAIDLTRPAWLNQAAGRGARIEVVSDLPLGLRAVGVASEIREVLVNLIRNAADAMPGGGTLTVRGFSEGKEAVVSIADTGVGMDTGLSKRIFEPFFTTKQQGMGTGLGLSVAWGIIARHNGRIEVESAPGQGSTFQVRLPLAGEETLLRTEGVTTPHLTGRHLLLVEDEPFVQEGLARCLEARGAKVALAGDAQEALQWLASHAGECDYLITDHGMVGLTGTELLSIVRASYPNIRRILLSGWGSSLPGSTDASAAELILTKPVRQDDLISALLRL